jgi:hypothetical protein
VLRPESRHVTVCPTTRTLLAWPELRPECPTGGGARMCFSPRSPHARAPRHALLSPSSAHRARAPSASNTNDLVEHTPPPQRAYAAAATSTRRQRILHRRSAYTAAAPSAARPPRRSHRHVRGDGSPRATSGRAVLSHHAATTPGIISASASAPHHAATTPPASSERARGRSGLAPAHRPCSTGEDSRVICTRSRRRALLGAWSGAVAMSLVAFLGGRVLGGRAAVKRAGGEEGGRGGHTRGRRAPGDGGHARVRTEPGTMSCDVSRRLVSLIDLRSGWA